jgi:hypothetical protein
MLGRLALSSLLLAVLVGCATTPEASRESDADAKRFEPALRAAVVYLYRPDIRGGVATIWIDNRLVGQTVSGTYFRVPIRAGHNIITASGSDQGRIEIDTRDEGVYFIEMRVAGEAEGSSTTNFRSVPAEAGKEALARCCSLLETWRPGQPRLGIFKF